MATQPTFDAPASDWLVYADELQQAGDLRGELIALNGAASQGDKMPERNAYVETHFAALFGLPPRSVGVKWGLAAHTVTVRVFPDDDAAAILASFFDSPMATMTRELAISGMTPESSDRVDLTAAVAFAAEKLPVTCKALSLVDDRATRASSLVSADYDPDENLVDFGSLAPLWTIGHLESLELHVADPMQLEFGSISSSSLRSFGLYGIRWADAYHEDESELAKTLTAATWPNLESLSLRLPETFTCSVPDNDGAYVRCERYDEDNYEDEGYDDGYSEGVNWDVELGPLLQSLHETKLSRLSLHSFDSSDALLGSLANGPLPPTLKTLDLSDSEVGQGDADWFVKNKARLENLEVLDLSRTRLSKRVAATLDSIGPRIIHSSGGSTHRFLVGME